MRRSRTGIWATAQSTDAWASRRSSRMSLATRKREDLIAAVAPEAILTPAAPTDGAHRGSATTTHPAIRTGIISPDLARKRHRALMRYVRRAQLRLYLGLPRLYVLKFLLEAHRISLELRCNFASCLAKILDGRHGIGWATWESLLGWLAPSRIARGGAAVMAAPLVYAQAGRCAPIKMS